MATKKAAAKKKSMSKKAAPAKPAPRARQPVRRASSNKPTALWFQYHAEAGLVRINVRGRDGEDRFIPNGEDIDIPLADLSEDTYNLVLDAFDAVAEEVRAVAFEPPEPEDEE